MGMERKLVWIGFFVGSTIGNMLPALWGGDMLSLSGMILGLLGAIAGIYVGYRIGRSI